MNILIVDDQRSARRILSSILAGLDGATLFEAASLDEARRVLAREAIDVALIDIRLDADTRNRDGLTLVGEIREKTTAVPIVVTVSQEMAEIRTAMRLGAYDYILKDDLCDELVLPILESLRRGRRLEQEVVRLRSRAAEVPPLAGIVGSSPPMERLRATIRRVALSDRPVLVIGPTGSGKELVVGAIHALGAHPDEPLVDVNCGAIPSELMESQLFGYRRGAFSGADRDHEGLFAQARKGTLFLDEIAELPMALQPKLLRALESGRFRPVGATQDQRFEGRVVAATHADLRERVAEGRFREDLYFRLDVLPVHVPGLAERREDIPALCLHFARQQHRPLSFSTGAMELLSSLDLPGGVRQLRNLIDRIGVFAERDEVDEALVMELTGTRPKPGGDDGLCRVARELIRMDVPDKLTAIEDALVREAMLLSDGNKTAAARLLGVHRKVVERRLYWLGGHAG